MHTHDIEQLPLYPEERQCKRPTAEQLLRLFSHTQRHILLQDGNPVQRFHAELTQLQTLTLALLEVPKETYR